MNASTGTSTLRIKDVCLAVMSALALQGAASSPAAAQTVGSSSRAASQITFDLPSAPLADTLEAIGRLAGQGITFDRAAMVGRQSPAIKGTMTARDAVAAAVRDADLKVAQSESGAIEVTASQQVVIYAKRDQAELGFKADRSDTATRSGTNLMDVPGSVTVITSKILETQQVINVRDALRNVSGIGFTDSPQGTPTFSVRGFSQSSLTSNGVPDNNASQANVFGVERIEVLKGPQAILAGGDSLGGGVNIVTKKPSADPVRDLTVQYGTNQDRTIAGDLSGALGADKRLSFRLIGSVSRAGRTDVGYEGRREDSLLPQLRWKDANTDLIVGASYSKSHQPVPEYTFARRDSVIMPTPSMKLSSDKDGFDLRQKRIFYQLEQKLGPKFTLVSRLQASKDLLDIHLYSPGGLRYDAGAPPSQTNGTSRFFPSSTTLDQKQIAGDHYVRAEFETGRVEHKLSVGAGNSNYNYVQRGYSGDTDQLLLTLYPASPVDLPEIHATNTQPSYMASTSQHQKGLFLQDLMSWGDWSLLLNLRRTSYTQYGHAEFFSAGFSFDDERTTVRATTPGVGVVYRVTPNTSLYGSYSEGFVPQTTPACGGGLVPPISSRNKELGAKFSLLNDKLSVTTAAFQIDQDGTLQYDNLNNCANVRPAQRTRGLELDVQGELARGWSAIFNYTRSRYEDVRDPTAVFPGKPRQKATLWTVYTLPFKAVEGLGLGLGISAIGKMEGTYNTRFPFNIPGQTQVDASVFYEQPGWGLTFGIKNVADRRLYGVSTSDAYVPVLAGRTFLLTLKKSFN